jgi:hypothetical protein
MLRPYLAIFVRAYHRKSRVVPIDHVKPGVVQKIFVPDAEGSVHLLARIIGFLNMVGLGQLRWSTSEYYPRTGHDHLPYPVIFQHEKPFERTLDYFTKVGQRLTVTHPPPPPSRTRASTSVKHVPCIQSTDDRHVHRTGHAGGAAAGDCCWLLAAGCWLLAAGCWLLAAGCWTLSRTLGCSSSQKPAVASMISIDDNSSR